MVDSAATKPGPTRRIRCPRQPSSRRGAGAAGAEAASATQRGRAPPVGFRLSPLGGQTVYRLDPAIRILPAVAGAAPRMLLTAVVVLQGGPVGG